IPRQFGLIIDGEQKPRPCRKIWSSQERVGAEYIADTSMLDLAETAAPPLSPSLDHVPAAATESARGDFVRMQLLTLRAALDEIEMGVVLLDAETRAQFINRAFRRMWRV